MTIPMQFNDYFCAGAEAAFDMATSANLRGAGAHVQKAICSWTICRMVETAAIVLDADSEERIGGLNSKPDFSSVRVFDDIVQGFFDDEKEVVADVGGNFPRGGLVGEIEPATNSRQAAERDVANDGDNGAGENGQDRQTKPPGFPEERRDGDFDGSDVFAPFAFIVAGGHLKAIVAGR